MNFLNSWVAKPFRGRLCISYSWSKRLDFECRIAVTDLYFINSSSLPSSESRGLEIYHFHILSTCCNTLSSHFYSWYMAHVSLTYEVTYGLYPTFNNQCPEIPQSLKWMTGIRLLGEADFFSPRLVWGLPRVMPRVLVTPSEYWWSGGRVLKQITHLHVQVNLYLRTSQVIDSSYLWTLRIVLMNCNSVFT